MDKKTSGRIAGGMLALACSFAACAQDYPNRPVRWIVAAATGTPIDHAARVVAPELSTVLGQSVVVENRPGASGVTGVREVLRMPADGYTIFSVTLPLTAGQSIYRSADYDIANDFTGIGQISESPNILVVLPSSGIGSVKEMIERYRASTAPISYPSSGIATTPSLAGEAFTAMMGIQAKNIPYSRIPQGVTDLLGGQHQFMFGGSSYIMPLVQAGRLKALAINGPKRLDVLPAVPTMAELGYPEMSRFADWQGLAVQRGTPEPVVRKLQSALAAALASPRVVAAFEQIGAEAGGPQGEAFHRLMMDETARWKKFAEELKISAD
ncbi:Tripartite tricarboxylate transporter family receptor [Pigmentiphaga humi]|uniref:Tripartite tricarboxylate transporter family receptor n=1 Tax=Pigmentiphaga humi TaxID=2478468 RepID=A0A3P4B6F9_9BURK|nr:tripartite tricarboxylate transporter substrate binding protein [Pigmentiphaga humi]VCU71879.1 Tripartite tricarboxylate transporter family receptor [Pigmentiphaga humi]